MGAAHTQGAPYYYVPSPSKWIYDATTHDVIGIGPYASLGSSTTPSISGTVTVFAATSLTNVFNDIKAKLTAVNPSLHLVMSYGGSATLKTQINTGTSPADVFASADLLNSPNAPLVASTTQFASNRLAIIAKPGNPTGVATVADLFAPGHQVILCQSAQPCGNASNQSFATIGKVRADLGSNLVSETANVGLVVTGVQSGAPSTVGLVYTTDAKAAGAAALVSVDCNMVCPAFAARKNKATRVSAKMVLECLRLADHVERVMGTLSAYWRTSERRSPVARRRAPASTGGGVHE